MADSNDAKDLSDIVRSARLVQHVVDKNGESTHERIKRSSAPFVSEADGEKLQANGHPAFVAIIASSPGIFLPSQENLVGSSISDLMTQIYHYTEHAWDKARDKIVTDLYKSHYSDAWKFASCSSRIILFRLILERCTADTFFDGMNGMLRDHSSNRDSNLRSFALMLNVILFEWPELTKYSQTTYRGIGTRIHDYQLGLTFTWTSFVSATTSEVEACEAAATALFIIDNSAVSDYKPRAIGDFSATVDSNTYIYPVASMFHITQVSNGACGAANATTIHISLHAGNYADINASTLYRVSTHVIIICTLLSGKTLWFK